MLRREFFRAFGAFSAGLFLMVSSGCTQSEQTLLAERMLDALQNGGWSRACQQARHDAPRVRVEEMWAETMVEGLFDLPRTEGPYDGWRDCVTQIFRNATTEELHAANAAFTRELVDILDSRRRRKNARALETLRVVYLETRADDALPRLAQAPLLALEARLDEVSEPPLREVYRRWIALLQLGRGEADGAAITRARIQTSNDESELLRFERFLPASPGREDAQRRVVQLRLRRSEYPELRSREAEVIEKVLETGYYQPPLDDYPARALVLEGSTLPDEVGLFPAPGFRTYVASPIDPATGRRLGPLELGSALRVRLEGLRAPVGICAAPRHLDPTPCLSVTTLRPQYGEWRETRHYVATGLGLEGAIRLATEGQIDLRFEVGRRELSLGTVRVSVRRPPAMRFAADPGQRGPDLDVRLSRPEPGFFVVQLAAMGRERFVLVPADALPSYTIVSRGGDGIPGAAGRPGSAGRDGADGVDAECPNEHGTPGSDGSDGGPGGDGQPGGHGGDGGTIRVALLCDDATCPSLRSLDAIRSLGGRGGKGGDAGPGGEPGRGGDGGRHADCRPEEEKHDDERGGLAVAAGVMNALLGRGSAADGRDGKRGPDGRPGIDGRPGRPGQVIDVTPGRRDRPAQRSQQPQTLFVLNARTVGPVSSDLAHSYVERLLAALQRVSGARGVGMSDLEALLDVEQQRDLLGCDDVSCIAEIAGAMDTDFLLRVNIGAVSDDLAVHLSLLERSSSAVIARADAYYPDAQGLLDGVPSLLRELWSRR